MISKKYIGLVLLIFSLSASSLSSLSLLTSPRNPDREDSSVPPFSLSDTYVSPHLQKIDSASEKYNVKSVESKSQIAYSPETVGDQRLFWINMPDLVQIRATLLSVGNYSYVYVANTSIELLGEDIAFTKANALSESFDDEIYPKGIELAGHPDGRLGDIDGDPHVTIFLAPLVRNMGTAYLGFVDFEDEFPCSFSNHREMVYVDSERNIYETICTIIHEFNHLIWNNYESDEAQFLTEGMANYAIDYTGYDSWVTRAVTTSFTYHPEISLLYFNRFYTPVSSYWDSSYGQAYLFATYLSNRFGYEVLQNLVSLQADGALTVELALANAGYTITWNELYLDWITACVIDDVTANEQLYGFETVNYRIQNHTIITASNLPYNEHQKYYYYGFNVKEVIARDYEAFTLEVENPQDENPEYRVGVSIIIRNSSGWYTLQNVYSSPSDSIFMHFSDLDIDELYLVTSLMSAETPTEYGAVLSLNDLPSVTLEYTLTAHRTGGNPWLGQPTILATLLIPTLMLGSGSIYLFFKKRNQRKNYINE